VVADAWERLVDDVVDGSVTGGLRAALLGRVAVALDVAGSSEQPASPQPLGTFEPSGDRWEGCFWRGVPPAWPSGTVPRPDQVLRALRRLSTRQRAVLVLRDVARLTAADVAAAIDCADDLNAGLESARDGYLVELDREVCGA
jgi:hypothetical protein